MKTALVKRFISSLLTLFIIISLSFLIMKWAPGNPYSQEKALSPENIAALKEKYDFSYSEYLTGVLKGDFRHSFSYRDQKVEDIIFRTLPKSIELGLLALGISLIFGILLGFLAALKPNSRLDYSLMFIAVLGLAIPNFVLGPILQYFFGLKLQWFPVAGWHDFSNRILPAITLATVYIAFIARLTRATVLEISKENYIKVAFAKGLPRHKLYLKHILPNISIPLLNFLGPASAALLTGTLVIEKIYNIPGMGRHFVDSAIQRDYPLALGVLLCYSIFLLLLNFFTDIVQSLVDRRITFQ